MLKICIILDILNSFCFGSGQVTLDGRFKGKAEVVKSLHQWR